MRSNEMINPAHRWYTEIYEFTTPAYCVQCKGASTNRTRGGAFPKSTAVLERAS